MMVKELTKETPASRVDYVQGCVNDIAIAASRNNPTLPSLAQLLDAVYNSGTLDTSALSRTVRYGNKAWRK